MLGKDGGDEWDVVRGRRGVDQMSEAGEVLLSCEEEICCRSIEGGQGLGDVL